MHIAATGSFVLVAGFIYKFKRTLKGAIIALFCGIVTMTAVMAIWNLIFTPIFMGVPIQAVLELMLPFIVPFNLIKASVNSILAFLLYKSVGNVIRKIVNK